MLRILAAFALLLPSIATAQSIELVDRISAGHLAAPPNRSVGDARYLAMSGMYPVMYDYVAEVYDLQAKKLVSIETTRKKLTAKFGIACDVCDDGKLPPHGDFVSYKPGRAGFHFYHIEAGPSWYAEIDTKTGDIVRTKEVANVGWGMLHFIGTDPAANAAWFSVLQPDPGRTGAQQAVLRRLDLATLAISDEIKVPLRIRKSDTGYEDQRFYHHSADWSRIVIVDYFEEGMKMSRGDVYVADTVAKSSFAIKAPSTAYGIAFSPDHKHMFMGSCMNGTISRVDLAAQKVDRSIPGPKFLHHLIVSPGNKLFALSSSRKFMVTDLGLDQRATTKHASEVEASFAQLFGAAAWSMDGKFVVLQDETRPGTHDYILAKLVD